MNLAPIVLFVYNRPWHTRQTVEALKNNRFAADSDLIIYSDGPQNESQAPLVNEVRNYIKTLDGFKSINIIEHKNNLGLANSIITGVTEVIKQYQKVVVLEDDLVTSSFFLKFLNDGLNVFQDEQDVISIHAYFYPVRNIIQLPETFFLKGAECWGWATWKRGWDLFNPNGAELLNELKMRKLTNSFDFQGALKYTEMLSRQIKGLNDSWAIRWQASAFVQNKLTLYPKHSFVKNIGCDLSGTHSGKTNKFDVEILEREIEVTKIPIVENMTAKYELMKYYHDTNPSLLAKIGNKLKTMF